MLIYCVYRNEDMNEGRGPMVLDRAFLHEAAAIRYMDRQEGVFGRKFKWSEGVHKDWLIRTKEVSEEE
jgi:hypothetical protein